MFAIFIQRASVGALLSITYILRVLEPIKKTGCLRIYKKRRLPSQKPSDTHHVGSDVKEEERDCGKYNYRDIWKWHHLYATERKEKAHVFFIFFIECYKEHTKPMPGVSAIRNSVFSYKIIKILFKWNNETVLRDLELLDVRRVSR